MLINEQLRPAPDARALVRWLAKLPKPVAVFCPNDLRARQLVHVCKQRRIDVPRDVSVLGLDNDVLVYGLAQDPVPPPLKNEERRGRVALIPPLR